MRRRGSGAVTAPRSLIWGLSKPNTTSPLKLGQMETPYLNLIAYPAIYPLWLIPGQLENIKTPHFLLPIQSHICRFQTQAVPGPGSGARLMRLSVDDLALLTYCLGVAPSPGMGLFGPAPSLYPHRCY
ncbi:hypothetical protein L3Q82_017636 [Xyrichtys novacula]|uniref:Uncharacterized protein n=1 Tax=Xyrichtys novacula TaxID=13765 RepID=A0AAV1H1E1_XYRNO|nr:hypothetical protein L3Q82_017636 [Xyrichtys novacula]